MRFGVGGFVIKGGSSHRVHSLNELSNIDIIHAAAVLEYPIEAGSVIDIVR